MNLPDRPTAWSLLALCLGAGLAAGFGEGLLLWGLQRLHWQTWDMGLLTVSGRILLLSILVDLAAFAALGVALLAAKSLFPRRLGWDAALIVVLAPVFYIWLASALTDRLAEYALILLALGLAVVVTRRVRARWGTLGGGWLGRWRWIAGAIGLVTALAAGGDWIRERIGYASAPAPPAGQPNMLVVIGDALRADHLGAYGYSRPISPTFDSLARRGVLFETALTTTSWTLPSHASLVTGRLPHEHRVEWCRPMGDGFPTIGELLRRRGYRTAGISANTMFFSRSEGLDRGFSHFEDIFYSPADMVSRTLLGRKYTVLVTYLQGRPKAVRFLLRPLGLEPFGEPKRAAQVTDDLLAWLDASPHERPFMAMLNYFDVHGPYLAPEPYAEMFSERKRPFGPLRMLPWRWKQDMTDAQLRYVVDTYDGALAYMDHEVGRLLQGLERRGLAGNTIVVITSDHGEMFREHGAIGHRSDLWGSELRVPLVFSWRGRLPEGARVPGPVSNAAIAATLLDLAGADSGFGSQGSLARLVRDPSAPPTVLSPAAELARPPDRSSAAPDEGWIHAVVTPDWYYIRHQRKPERLFDQRRDTAQSANLAETATGQAALLGLRDSLARRFPGPADLCWAPDGSAGKAAGR